MTNPAMEQQHEYQEEYHQVHTYNCREVEVQEYVGQYGIPKILEQKGDECSVQGHVRVVLYQHKEVKGGVQWEQDERD